MNVTGLNNLQNSTNFGAKTRSERQQEVYYQTILSQDEMDDLVEIRANKRQNDEEVRNRRAEREYNDDVRDLKETKQMVHDLTHADKKDNIFAGSTLKKVGTVADVLITGTLSGMALHWSTGKAFSMLYKVSKKPKIANTIAKIKEPFKIVGSAISAGLKTTWTTFSNKVQKTGKFKRFMKTDVGQKVNSGVEQVSTSVNNVRSDIKKINADNVKSGISNLFGVSGFTAGVVNKLDGEEKKDA